MQRLIVLLGLTPIEKTQLANDLAVHLQQRGHTVRRVVPPSMAEDPAWLDEITQAAETVLIWNTPAETDLDQLATQLLSVEAHGVQPLTIALIDTRTCECFPALEEQLEQTADLTLRLPFDIEETLWSISAQL